MNENDYLQCDATALAELVRNGAVSAEEVTEAAIARAEAVNPRINAIVTPMYDAARRHARSGVSGPLGGVPFLVKDLNYVKGVRCSFGSRLWADFVPDHDAEIVTRYRKAGLVLLGKSNTPEVGLAATTESVFLGPCRNPWDLTRTAGGSSGGAAAAVAAGIVPVAHATDGGGSIRIPASCCGLVGLKVSRGRLTQGPGAADATGGLSVDGFVTKSVRDTAAALDATCALNYGDPYFAPPPEGSYLEGIKRKT